MCSKFCFDMYGDRKSQLTFLLYLNDDFEGGHTSFFETAAGDKPGPGNKICAVKVPQGGALCFYHGTVHLSFRFPSSSSQSLRRRALRFRLGCSMRR
jgi:hypothetical protein